MRAIRSADKGVLLMSERGSLRSTLRLCGSVALIGWLVAACGDDTEDAANTGARAPEGGTMTAKDASMPWKPPPPLETAGPVRCQGDNGMVTCQPQFGIAACCPERGGCGTLSPIGNTCIASTNPGHPDDSCEPIMVSGFNLPGCCAEGGRCGGMSAFSGCVPRELLAGNPKTAACDYDPENNCTAIQVLTVCDGNEDCDDGQVCAADFSGARYGNYRCMDADSLAQADAVAMSTNGAVSQICHAGDECVVEGYQCRINTMYQPEFAGRCRDTGDPVGSGFGSAAGEINCGREACDAKGQKCCVPVNADGIQSDSAYCAPLEAECKCRAPETDEMDAGPEP
jgi:hypothetical protein